MEDGNDPYSLVQEFSLQDEDIIDTRFIGEDWQLEDIKTMLADVLQRLAVIEAKLATDTK
jgi:hypothetical protein